MPVGQDRTQHGTGTGGRQAARAAAGNNHGGGRRAIAALLLLLGLGFASPALAQATPEGNPLVQRDVPAEATAENAVVARDRALASGQRIAYGRMAAQLGLPTGLSDQQIEGMVASLVIESERITPRGYSARITVNFRQPNRAEAAAAAEPGGGGAAAPAASGPPIASVEATALYRSFPEYIEISRRLSRSPTVARVEVLSVSGDMARLRLGLRNLPPQAAEELAGAGLQVAPALPAAGAAAPAQGAPGGGGWRLGLAGGR
ncbi:hypothetical protein [Roseomonas sp. AR75]|uniref:hypothetical protein n=1 Tax=Roseomonas sp. AR75 TaxID=2562311 RepID=UPI0010BFF9FC|nr:hypothetical protein [Roseomonas sp. AR75]